MRKVLLRIVFDQLWMLQSAGNEFLVGYGWAIVAWLIIAVIGLGILWKLTQDRQQLVSSMLFWGFVPAGIALIPVLKLPIVHSGIPVFGYGFMMFIGFSAGTLLASRRAQTVGLNADVIWDLMMWLLLPGIAGARVVYLMQNWDKVVGAKSGVELLKSVVALWDGGIVFYGGVIGGLVGLFAFCKRNKIRPLLMADIIIPSLFVGLGFGRIGCFLYGCCYGGTCSLPWSVKFPPDSMTFEALSMRAPEFIAQDGMSTVALHPAQIYSSILAFLLAGFLMWFFPRRPFEGAVLALGWIIYPINRFVLENIRFDEPGRLGTPFTFSQLMSMGLFVTGCIFMFWLHKKNANGPVIAVDSKADAGA